MLLEHHTDLEDILLHTEAQGSSSCMGMCILHTVAGFVGTTDSTVGAAWQKIHSLPSDTAQSLC